MLLKHLYKQFNDQLALKKVLGLQDSILLLKMYAEIRREEEKSYRNSIASFFTPNFSAKKKLAVVDDLINFLSQKNDDNPHFNSAADVSSVAYVPYLSSLDILNIMQDGRLKKIISKSEVLKYSLQVSNPNKLNESLKLGKIYARKALPDFKKMVSIKKFRQIDLIENSSSLQSLNDDETFGMCTGLSIFWYQSVKNDKDFLDELSSADINSSLITDILKKQEKHSSINLMFKDNEYVNNVDDTRSLKDELAAIDVKSSSLMLLDEARKHLYLNLDLIENNYLELSFFVQNNSIDNNTIGHTIGLCKKGDDYLFFDSNIGEYRFKEPIQMIDYLLDEIIEKIYKNNFSDNLTFKLSEFIMPKSDEKIKFDILNGSVDNSHRQP